MHYRSVEIPQKAALASTGTPEQLEEEDEW